MYQDEQPKKKWYEYAIDILKYILAAIAGYGANEIPF